MQQINTALSASFKGKKLLLVHLGGPLKIPIIKILIEHGVDLYLAQDQLPDYLSGLIQPDHFIQTDPYHLADLLSKATRFMLDRLVRFDAVGTYFEHAVPNTAILAQLLGLPGIEPGIAYRSSNCKAAMRGLCKQAGIRSPAYLLLGKPTKQTLQAALQTLGGAAVLKPVYGDDSNGVILFDRSSDLEQVLHFIQRSCTVAQEKAFQYFTGEYMAESLLEGIQVSVDGIVQEGHVQFAGMVETVLSPPPYFTALANYIPPRIDEAAGKQAEAYCRQVIQVLGFNNCGFHAELRLTVEGPVLIEISCRPPGGKIMEGYQLAYGIDLVTAMLCIWLGQPVRLLPAKKKYIYQAGIFPDRPGTVMKLEGLEKAAAEPGLLEMQVVTGVGGKAILYPALPVPVFYFAVEASDAAALKDRINRIKAHIHIEIA